MGSFARYLGGVLLRWDHSETSVPAAFYEPPELATIQIAQQTRCSALSNLQLNSISVFCAVLICEISSFSRTIQHFLSQNGLFVKYDKNG